MRKGGTIPRREKQTIPSEHFSESGGSIEAPDSLRLPICCAGLSTMTTLPLTNPTNRWLHVTILCVRVSVNGVPNYHVSPFVVKEKVMVEPHRTEDIKVSWKRFG